MRPKRFSGFFFIRNAQNQTFEIRECIRTETFKSYMTQKPIINSPIQLKSTVPEEVETLLSHELIILYDHIDYATVIF